MKRGDSYFVDLCPISGREQQGHRPFVIAFNAATKLPVVLPITAGDDFGRRPGFAVPITGIKTTGIVRCDQPRVLDITARNGRKADALPPDILAKVLARVITLFE